MEIPALFQANCNKTINQNTSKNSEHKNSNKMEKINLKKKKH